MIAILLDLVPAAFRHMDGERPRRQRRFGLIGLKVAGQSEPILEVAHLGRPRVTEMSRVPPRLFGRSMDCVDPAPRVGSIKPNSFVPACPIAVPIFDPAGGGLLQVKPSYLQVEVDLGV